MRSAMGVSLVCTGRFTGQLARGEMRRGRKPMNIDLIPRMNLQRQPDAAGRTYAVESGNVCTSAFTAVQFLGLHQKKSSKRHLESCIIYGEKWNSGSPEPFVSYRWNRSNLGLACMLARIPNKLKAIKA